MALISKNAVKRAMAIRVFMLVSLNLRFVNSKFILIRKKSK